MTPGIGQSSIFDVSGGSFSGISLASSATRGDRTRAVTSMPRQRSRMAGPTRLIFTPTASPSMWKTVCNWPGSQPPVTAHLPLSAKATAMPSTPVDSPTGNSWPASVTTQSLPTLRW
ncbi:hypothetical protein D3C72_1870400 [compost metagenome]